MLIFKRGHTHIKQDDLSEYLDGRLSDTAASRIDRRLTECATCRQELETLRSTVSLLQRMPELTLPRSFVLPGPPPAPIAIRLPVPLRMPQWVYSGAAAAAVLVLAVLISADATGLFTPNSTAQQELTAHALKAAPERFQGDGAAGAIEIAAPQAPVAEQAVSAEQGLSVTVTKEIEVAPAEAPALRQAAAPVQPALESAAKAGDSVPPAPEAAMAAAAVEAISETEAPSTPTIAALAAAVDDSAATESTPPPPVTELAAVEQRTEPSPVAQDSPGSIPPPYNPINIWRVLEGLAAVAAVGFLVMWLLRRRAGR